MGHALLLSKTVQIQSFTERVVRWMCVTGAIIAGSGFIALGYVALNAAEFHLCCADVWKVPTMEDINYAVEHRRPRFAMQAAIAHDANQPMLFNTAYGLVLVIKIVEYWCEVFSGLFMVSGLLSIWWFSVERNFDLDEDIPDIPK